MRFVLFKGAEVVRSERLPKGHHFITVGLDEVPVFIRPGRQIPLCEPSESVDQLDTDTVTYLSFD